jgi:hypothetical protein
MVSFFSASDKLPNSAVFKYPRHKYFIYFLSIKLHCESLPARKDPAGHGALSTYSRLEQQGFGIRAGKIIPSSGVLV